jgi:DNA polymerase-1
VPAKTTTKKVAEKAADKAVSPSGARLVILDGHGIIYRAYFAVREPLVVRRSGEVVTAVYGFINTLLRVIDELKPTHLAVAMDAPGKTFRHEADPSYKAHRRETPEDLPPQIERCKDVMDAFSIPIYEMPGYEADDVLATLADAAAEQGVETWIATLDSDLIQLVRPGVSVFMYRPYQRDTVRYDSLEKVRDRYNIDPVQMIDYKGLVGDTSDNIPGVPGIGEKTAVKLLNEYRTIEEIYEHIDEVGPKRAHTALVENQDVALHSKMMATIRHDVPVELDIDAAQVAAYDRQRVMEMFQELEFRSLIDRLPAQDGVAGEAAVVAETVATSYETIRDDKALKALVKRLKKAPSIAFQPETTSRDAMRCDIAGYAFADAPGKAAYVPVRHLDDGLPLLDHEAVLKALTPLFESSDVAKVLHDAKFATKVLHRQGVALRGVQDDTMLAAFLLGDSATALPTVALERLGIELPTREELLGKGRKQKTLFDVGADDTGEVAAAEVDATLRLAAVLGEALDEEPQIEEMYRSMEIPLSALLAEMEFIGVRCEPARLEDLRQRLAAEIESIRADIYEEVGHEFNIGSPKQLGVVLFEEMGLPKTRRTKQGYSTDAQALERLSSEFPIVERILHYREVSKLKSTYVDTLPGLVHPDTHRIHTEYNQAVAATGRLSSENPNLQNIPVRTEMGREIRAAFIAAPASDAEEDVVFLGVDYSQVELRVLAHLSADPAMIEAFRNNEDIHAATASGAYGVPASEVSAEMRRIAKMMNFGVIYGLTSHGLSARADMDRRDAQTFIDAYFERFSRVAEYLEEVKASTKDRGYAETLLGRRRYIPEIKSSNFQVRSAAERVAVNMPVQGTAADVMKRAMLQIDAALKEREVASRMILQVHDELIFELPRQEVPEVAGVLQEIMPSAIEMVVPLQVDMKVGPNWRDMEPYAL